ncbi:MAG: hypothetical protein AAF517_05380 [Planctomycetota bacterium]
MHRERPNLDLDGSSAQKHEELLRRDRHAALEVLSEARDRLLQQLCDDVLSNRDVILDGSADGLFRFEFQEIEDRYNARLHALNSLLENLEYRRPRISHRVETFRTSVETISKDLPELVERYDQWDIIDIDVTKLDGDELMVVVSFTVDEYDS